jgi:hypothetical protein
MEVPKALFPYSGALISFVRAVKSDLFAETRIMYFEIAEGAHQIEETELNKNILNSIGGKSGVYAIWVKKETEVSIRYIGHTDGKTSRQRIRNHFITKHDRTGAQLENVKEAIKEKCQVGLTFVEIDPPSLRLYVEMILINENYDHCHWNIKSKKKSHEEN